MDRDAYVLVFYRPPCRPRRTISEVRVEVCKLHGIRASRGQFDERVDCKRAPAPLE